MNYQYDLTIIGDSKAGHEILNKVASNNTIKIAFISKIFKSFTTHDYLNVEYFKNEVIFTDYKNRLFGCYLDDGTRIYSTHIVIATGLAYAPLILNNKIVPDVFNNVDDIPKTAKNQPAVVICNRNNEVKFALDVAKKYKQVYLCTKDLTINNITAANNKKLANTENLIVLPNTSIAKAIVKDNALQKIELDSYSTLNCVAIYVKTAAKPDTNFVSNKLIEMDENGYLVTSENAESMLVPKCFAAGNCAKKYTKTVAQNLITTILKDF
jgi:thioredoxin reductase